MKKYLILSITILSLFSCKKSDLKLYDGENLLKFNHIASTSGKIIDSTTYSFALQTSPDVRKVKFPFILKKGGVALNTDGKFMLVVDEEKTTAVEGVHYTKLPEFFTFRKGLYQDTIYVELLRDALVVDDPENPGTDLRIGVNLALKIVDGGDFKVGIQERERFSLKFSDKIEQPEWWYLHNWYSFGDYSNTKYTILLYVSKGDNLSAYEGWDIELKQYTFDMMTYLDKVYKGQEENTFNVKFDADGNPLDENGEIIAPAPYI